jgi:hypothetical protein
MYVSLGFQTTGGGRYAKYFYITDRWVTYVFPMSSFGVETSSGPVTGWNNVNLILLSCWQVTDPTPATCYISDLRASNNRNILQNSGFEVTTAEAMPDYWGPTMINTGSYADQWVLDMDSWRARWGVDRTVSHSGTNSLRIVSSITPPATTPPVDLQAAANFRELSGNRTSTLSVWLRSDQPNLPVTLQVLGCTPSAFELVGTSPTPNSWQRYSVNITPIANSSRVSCLISPTGNGTLWVDDVQLEDGTAATDWQPSLTDADIGISTPHKVVPLIGDIVVTPGANSVTVSIDGNGRFLVDGEPFIPMAIVWAGLPSSAITEHIAKAGFNTILAYL